MATIKGTTAVLKGKTISTGDNVIITDNLYTIADINNFFGASGLKIKLEKTAAATQFVETAANLLAVLEKVEKYTGAVTATPAAASTAINDVAGLTTGVVTATILNTEAIDATLLVSLTNVKPSDKISYTPTTPAATTEATDIVAIKKILPLAVLGGGVSSITGGSADVAALKAASNIVNNKPVTVTAGEAISAADANAIAKNSSAVIADVKAASAASLNSALKDLSAADTLSLTVSGKSATAADLKALVTKIGAGASTVDVDGIETITGNATDVKAVLAHAKFAPVGGTPEIKVSGTISVVDANTIATSGKAGDVTATVAAGTAASLNGALGALGGDDKLSLTVINNFDGSATDATHLVTLAGKTASKITVNAKAITGTEAQILDIYIQSLKDNFTGLGNKAVTVTGAVTGAYDLNAILKATSGVVTATIADNIAVLKGALTDAKGTDNLYITVNDASVNAADLKALDAKTSVAIDAKTATDLTGSAADIKAVLKAVANGGIELAANVKIAPTGTISAADANAFSDATTGAVTATVTAGSATALNKALKDVPATSKDDLTLTVTGATATTADLTALTTKTSEPVDASAVKTITGSLADLGAFYVLGATEIVLNASSNATISGTVAVADLATLESLLGNVPGKVTATVTPSTAAVLAAALNANGKPTDALTFNVVEDRLAGAVVATDAEDLVTLDNQTFVKVKVDATQIEGDYAELEHIYISGKAGFSNLGNETVEVTGTTTAARVDSILKATTGVVTAAVGVIGAETAANLVSSLKNAKNDALALEITSGSVANAADLKALDAKTTVAIDADSISKLVGNAADVKTVLAATTGINLGAVKDIDVSGTISAADANTIALNVNAGVVTATVKADTAAKLNDALGTLGGADKLSLTVTGASANAADLNGLNGKTTEAVNASAIKTVTGTATDIATLYAAGAAEVSGLGTKAVSVTGEASAADITSINTATTGLINVASVNTALTADGTFALSTGLGNLSEITGLYNLSAADGVNTGITFSIADLLAANDSSKSFDFSIVGDGAANTDTVTITNTSGWTVANNTVNLSQYVFTKGSQTITINLTDIDAATVI